MKTETKIKRNYFVGTLLCFFFAFHAVTIVHEFLGHGLAVKLLRGKITDFYISWMGGSGYVKWDKLVLGSVSQRIFVNWAGIGATLVCGGLLWLLWKHYFKYTIWSGMLLWVLIISMVTSSFGCTVLGLHYIYGDVRETALFLQNNHLLGVVVWTVIFIQCAVMFFISRYIVFLQHKWVDLTSWWKHFLFALLIVGGAAGTVALLNIAENFTKEKKELKVVMKKESVWKAETIAAEENIKRIHRGVPQMTEKQKQEFIRKKTKELSPWPLLWAYVPLLLFAFILGTRNGRTNTTSLKRPSIIPLWLWGAAAGSIILSGVLSLF